MNNQNSGDGGASPDLQPMIDPASNGLSGQTPPVVSLTSTSVPAGASSPSSTSGLIEPDGVKIGHD